MPAQPVGRRGRRSSRGGPAGYDRLQVGEGRRDRLADNRQGRADFGPELFVGNRVNDLVQLDDRFLVWLNHTVKDIELQLLEAANRGIRFWPADSVHG